MLRIFYFSLALLTVFSLNAQENYQKYMKLSYAEIDSLMMIEYNRGALDEAILYMEAGREKAKDEFGEVNTKFTTYTSNLAYFHQSIGNYESALPLYIQLIELDEKILGKEHLDFANSLNNLAVLYREMGSYELSLPLFLQAINIEKKKLGLEHPDFALSLNNLADLHQEMGNYELALPLYVQSKNIYEKAYGKEHPKYAISLNDLALLHKRMGNYDLAQALFLESIKIKERTLGMEHSSLASTLNNLAITYQDRGNYELALPLYIRAKKIRKKAFGAQHSSYATSLNNLASLHRDMGNYELALPLFLQSRDIYKGAVGTEHPDFAMALNNLAFLHLKMSELKSEERKEHYKKAWEFLEQAIRSSSSLELDLIVNENWRDRLNNAPYASMEHLDKMIKSLKLVYTLLSKDNDKTNSLTQKIYVTDLAVALLNKARNKVSNEKDKLRILAQSNDWLINSLKVLDVDKQKDKAFLRADQNKSVLLLQSTKSEATYQLGGVPDSLMWMDKKMLKKRSQLQAKLLEKRSESEKNNLRNELIQVNQEIEDFITMLKKEYPKYHKLKYEQTEVNLKDIQPLLDDKTVLIEYVISDSVLHIFSVGKKTLKWEQQLILATELTQKIEVFHQALSDYEGLHKDEDNALKKYTATAFWFYQNLLAPVLQEEDNIENLIIVTDGQLGHLPFEAFLMKAAADEDRYQDLEYLVKKYNVSYNYSAALWKENKDAPKKKNNGQLLAMVANYELRKEHGIGEPATNNSLRSLLTALPVARLEVEALEEAYRGYFAFDSLASEKMIKQLAPDFAIIHLAMHGLLDEKRPMLSSLAFTDDGDSIETNFWQAYEISKMELNADLVVLSACETGYGKFETGNGIASLARSFMYAGVSSLVVSLWQVNDQSTAVVMQNFYKHLAQGQTKSEALRKAKLDYVELANGVAAHPAFWSPFILIGDERPVKVQSKGNRNFWFWGSVWGGVLLLALGAFFMRKKRKSI